MLRMFVAWATKGSRAEMAVVDELQWPEPLPRL